MSFVILRGVAVVALILLLWNPSSSHVLPTGDQPIVLLDASLSMSSSWRAAMDSVGPLARRRAVVWRFGNRVAAFDSTPPTDGATRLGPALEAAAGRAGEVVVVTDGAVDDAASIPADLLRRPRVVLLPRPQFFDAYVAGVEGVRHVTRGDTLRLRVSYGTAGKRDAQRPAGKVTLSVSVEGHHLVSQAVSLPDSGLLMTEITLPASRIPRPGWSVLEISLDGVNDTEPRDDKRLFAIDVSLEPAAVIFASPPDWEARFLARTVTDVARMPVKMFVETEPGRWRDAVTLAPIGSPELTRAAQGARLVALVGNPDRARAFVTSKGAAQLMWPASGQPGDWYVDRPPSSPLTGVLSGVVWDSLPPATSAGPAPDLRDTTGSQVVALTARLARRGAARPIVVLQPRATEAGRRATITASGLWRWAFRGGASEQAYRSLVAALVDWLLWEPGARSRERAVPESFEVPDGLPIRWRWSAPDTVRALAITLHSVPGDTTRSDTLRFDAAGRAELLLPPGVYRYALGGGTGGGGGGTGEQGVVAVETYSDEWRPHTPVLTTQPGDASTRLGSVGLRDRWWLFVIAIAALAAEWTLRRRQGLP